MQGALSLECRISEAFGRGADISFDLCFFSLSGMHVLLTSGLCCVEWEVTLMGALAGLSRI